MKPWIRCALVPRAALVILLIGGCTTPPPRTPPAAPTESLPPAESPQKLSAAIAADAKASDAERDAKVRAQLAADATRDAETCMARDPHAVPCLYGRAISLGLDARVHPTRAGELLKEMLDALAAAEAADPAYDDAGPARVRALVLVRSPGWPIGPGDPDAGLVAARRAVALRPHYPPNLLALAEALGKTGDASAAREAYTQARDEAQAQPASNDRNDWVHQADDALKRE